MADSKLTALPSATLPLDPSAELGYVVQGGASKKVLVKDLAPFFNRVVVFDGQGSVPGAGKRAQIEVPCDCTITAARMFADQAGSAVIDVRKATYAAFPTVASICAAALPTLTTAVKSQDTTLTGWTVNLSKGDVLDFILNSASTLYVVELSLSFTRR